MSQPPLDKNPDHKSLRVLRDAGILRSEQFWVGTREITDPKDWAVWGARLSLLIGSALIMAGVVFFFAFNWDGLDRWQKLGLLQLLTVATLIGGQWVGFGRSGGKLLLMGSAVSVGVSFAVFGQVYQTGADAFGFFGIWAVAIIPWVAVGTFAPLWVLWFTLINLTAFFFWDQVGQYHESIHYTYVCLGLSLINATGLILREVLAHRYEWLKGLWLRHLFLLGVTIPLMIPSLDMVFSQGVFRPEAEEAYNLALGTAVWLIQIGASYLYFTRRRFDSSAICIVLGSAAIFLLSGIARMFEEVDLYDGGFGFLLMALIIGGVTTLIVKLLRWLKSRYGREAREAP